MVFLSEYESKPAGGGEQFVGDGVRTDDEDEANNGIEENLLALSIKFLFCPRNEYFIPAIDDDEEHDDAEEAEEKEDCAERELLEASFPRDAKVRSARWFNVPGRKRTAAPDAGWCIGCS